MLKRFVSFLGFLIIASALTLPALAVEGTSERAARKKLEAQKLPQQAYEALQENKPDQAIELFTKAINSRAFNDQPQTLGELYYGRAQAYRMKEDCTSALPDYTKAMETLNDGDLYYNRAGCYVQLQQDDLALADIDKAIKVDPEAIPYRSSRCIMLFNKKDYAGALPDCEKALTRATEDKTLLAAAGQASEITGNKTRAAELYRKLLSLDPASTVALEGLKRVGG